MIFRRVLVLMTGAAAMLLVQSCVEYVPVAESPPAAQAPAPSYPEPYAAAPAAPPQYYPAPAPAAADDSLVAPIALYPDPLIAIILPAATVPSDISAASAYLVQYGDMSQIDSQPWDPSVRALAHYPPVIAWMAENIAWTEALGSAFASSPADVMDSIQRLRARAEASGALTSTSQQQVVSDDGDIQILPAQPDAVYIPVYDDSVVYSDASYSGYGGPFINFGSPYPSGIWLSYSFDWRRHRVWDGGRDNWHEHDGWHPPHFDGDRLPPGARPWHPPQGVGHNAAPARPTHAPAPPAPRPMAGAPNPPPAHYRQSPPAPSQAAPGPRAPQPSQWTAPPLERPRLDAPGAPVPKSPAPAVRPPANEPRPPESQSRYTPPDREPSYSQEAPAEHRSAPPAQAEAPAHDYAPAPAARPKEAAPAAHPAPVRPAPQPAPAPTPNAQQPR
jgi:hypothetical protein